MPAKNVGIHQLPAWIAVGVAGVMLSAGVSAHIDAVQTRDQLKELPSGAQRDELIDQLETDRNAMIGLYGATAVSSGLAVYLWRRASKARRQDARSAVSRRGIAPVIGGRIDVSGVGVWMRWSM